MVGKPTPRNVVKGVGFPPLTIGAKNMSNILKRFKKYTIEIEEVDGRLCAYLTKGDYSASWECACNEGELSNERGWVSPIYINNNDYEQVEKWLSSQGYYD